MSTHDDHSTLIDALDRVKLVDKLAMAVMTCTPPRVYGVHGDWGAGKTSFLHQLHYTLDGMPHRKNWVAGELQKSKDINTRHNAGSHPCPCGVPDQRWSKQEDALVVWFEAWRYQHEPAPVVALLHEIRGQLGRRVRATNWGKKIAEVTLRSGLMQLEQIANFASIQSGGSVLFPNNRNGLAATVQEQGERWEREHLAEKLPAETMREQLEHAIMQLLGRDSRKTDGSGRRVVVLIDDLDRCEPQATYRLLEGIKIYLSIPNCVFVLGMDQRVIVDAIALSAPGAKEDVAGNRPRAREYLEKLFQEIYHLPIVQDVPKHTMAWLRNDMQKVPQTLRDTLRTLLTEYSGCVPANPRKVKAFAAVLWRFLTEPDAQGITNANFAPLPGGTAPAQQHPYEALVIIMAALYHFHPDVYRVLEAHPKTFYDELWLWCVRTAPNGELDHACLRDCERAYRVQGVVNRGQGPLPEMTTGHTDYSRGNVLRVQKMIYDTITYTEAQIRSLLLT